MRSACLEWATRRATRPDNAHGLPSHAMRQGKGAFRPARPLRKLPTCWESRTEPHTAVPEHPAHVQPHPWPPEPASQRRLAPWQPMQPSQMLGGQQDKASAVLIARILHRQLTCTLPALKPSMASSRSRWLRRPCSWATRQPAAAISFARKRTVCRACAEGIDEELG